MELERKIYDQTKSLECDPIQEAVDKYVEENSPYGPFVPPRMNIHKYLQFIEENNISDPTTIPDEIMDTFMLPESTRRIAQ